ncbi:hypothetical protein [Longispora albida]|uniref:hypothetical protein n=1 Tax=Longispora albida TaxID=203523 RepID=UPI00036A1CD8|nr:hypothetical protein [Longispora albida]
MTKLLGALSDRVLTAFVPKKTAAGACQYDQGVKFCYCRNYFAYFQTWKLLASCRTEYGPCLRSNATC